MTPKAKRGGKVKAQTHIEDPMFSNKLACGKKRTRGVSYTWMTKTGKHQATCAPCIAAWNRRAGRVKRT